MSTKLSTIGEARVILRQFMALKKCPACAELMEILASMAAICDPTLDKEDDFARINELMTEIEASFYKEYPKEVLRLWELLYTGQGVKCGGGV